MKVIHVRRRQRQTFAADHPIVEAGICNWQQPCLSGHGAFRLCWPVKCLQQACDYGVRSAFRALDQSLSKAQYLKREQGPYRLLGSTLTHATAQFGPHDSMQCPLNDGAVAGESLRRSVSLTNCLWRQDEGALAGEGLRRVTLRSSSRTAWSSDLRPPAMQSPPFGRPANPAAAAVDSYVESLRRTPEVRLSAKLTARLTGSCAEAQFQEHVMGDQDVLRRLAVYEELDFGSSRSVVALTHHCAPFCGHAVRFVVASRMLVWLVYI